MAVLGMEVFANSVPTAHSDCLSVVIASSFIRGLLQFLVLKSAQNPSDSLVPRTHQEVLGSFVCRYLKTF